MNVRVGDTVTVALNRFMSLFLKNKYYLSVCCIVKDENAYLEEWLSYHLAAGVQHFFLYDNDSAVPIQNTIDEIGLSNKVSVIRFPGASKQVEAYRNCLRHFGRLSRWIAFIDVDEFIVPKLLPNNLCILLEGFEAHGGLGVNWQCFGSSGHLAKSTEPQLKTFTLKAQTDFHVNRHIKSIIQPRYVRTVRDPHSFKYLQGKQCVNETYKVIKGPFSDVSVEKIQINHYFCRSREEFLEKINRGRADDSEISRSLEQFYGLDEYANAIEDTTILTIVENQYV